MLYTRKRKKRKANVSATYGGPLQCHKLNDSLKIFVKNKNIVNNLNKDNHKTQILSHRLQLKMKKSSMQQHEMKNISRFHCIWITGLNEQRNLAISIQSGRKFFFLKKEG